MLIDTRAIDFALTEGILRHVESRLESALGPFARNVLRVTVRLEDVNANRGGIDKRCSVVVALRRRGVVVAEATHEDLYAAVDKVATRMRRSVKRAVERHVALERKDPQRPGALVTI
ncbi:MAG: ribosome-associated translation inhibitor RaiA [Tepidisphaeraceae bacterium]